MLYNKILFSYFWNTKYGFIVDIVSNSKKNSQIRICIYDVFSSGCLIIVIDIFRNKNKNHKFTKKLLGQLN